MCCIQFLSGPALNSISMQLQHLWSQLLLQHKVGQTHAFSEVQHSDFLLATLMHTHLPANTSVAASPEPQQQHVGLPSLTSSCNTPCGTLTSSCTPTTTAAAAAAGDCVLAVSRSHTHRHPKPASPCCSSAAAAAAAAGIDAGP